MVNPHKIKFRKFFSNEINIPDLIMCCAFDSDNSEVTTYLNREAVSVESHDGRYNNTIKYKYNERFSPRFTFLKKGFGDFEMSEVRTVLKWLTSSDKTSLLDVYYDDSNVIAWSAIGNWTEIESYKLANNRTVGIVATFESVTPYALSPLHNVTQEFFDTSDKDIVINIETDDAEALVYPRITIHQHDTSGVVEVDHVMTDADEWIEGTVYHYGTNYYWIDPQPNTTTGGIQYVKTTSNTRPTNIETTSVVLTNTYTNTDGKLSEIKTVIKNNVRGETIVLDGANKIISSSRVNGRIFGDDFSWNWLPLFEGSNTISVTGKCTIGIEYRTPIKCGEY